MAASVLDLSVIVPVKNEEEPRIRFISFDHNHGQTAAMLAGFREAQGRILATLDGDGQNDPRDLPVMVKKIMTGQADLVNGRRACRHDSFIRKISSRIGNGFRNRITGETVADVGCSIRVFWQECVADFPPLKGFTVFSPPLSPCRALLVWRCR